LNNKENIIDIEFDENSHFKSQRRMNDLAQEMLIIQSKRMMSLKGKLN